MLPRFAYLALCRFIQLLALLARSDAAKDLEILVLRPTSTLRTLHQHRAFAEGESSRAGAGHAALSAARRLERIWTEA
jgi:hypothetical protein